MRIAVAQVDCVLGDIDANVERAAKAIAQARADGAELVVFPELNLSGYSVGQVEDDLDMRTDDARLLRLADDAGPMGLLLGFCEDGAGVHTYNSAAYFQAGQLVHVHRKLYLPTYDIFEERKHFSPGQHMRAFDTAHDRCAILTCNDAWQPQLAFLAVQDGARILLMPTSSAQSRFPRRYDSPTYWRDITTFYARMFQVYVVFVNRVGAEGQLRFWGGSHVVDPWGGFVAEAPLDEEAVLTVDIDRASVRRRRREVPLVREARLGLVQREVQRLVEEGGDL
ncbi:MAG: amidohydrolase [Geodermatophilaceae bacterium]|nr:amidohydrolase [Geodermatophilaceae bacterium]MDQ3455254.1 amidohydrolase [Actinomycetota bacterium]